MTHEVVTVYGFDDSILGWNVEGLFVLVFTGLGGSVLGIRIVAILDFEWSPPVGLNLSWFLSLYRVSRRLRAVD